MNTRSKTLKLIQLSLLSAIIIIMSLTPLGYLTVGGISITFIMIPVGIGAIIMGPLYGAILGFVFGMTSFIMSFTGSPLMQIFVGTSIFKTFILCVVPRTLMGLCCGLIFKALYGNLKTRNASYLIAGACAAILNTLFFVPLMGFLFGEPLSKMALDNGVSLFALVLGFITINSVIEAVSSLLICGTVSKTVHMVEMRKKTA